jgi:putative lipoprotein
MRVKNAKPLEGTEWHLVKIGGESLTLSEDTFNIILQENGLGGRGACNSLLGKYAMGDKFALRFSALGSTKMLCPHNESLEMKMIQILSQTTHYDIDYDMLMLMRNGSVLAVFKAKK